MGRDVIETAPSPGSEGLDRLDWGFKIEGKADRTAKVYNFICPIFRLDKLDFIRG